MHKWLRKGLVLLVSASTLGEFSLNGITSMVVNASSATETTYAPNIQKSVPDIQSLDPNVSRGLDVGTQQMLTNSQWQQLLQAIGQYADSHNGVSGLRQFFANEANKLIFDQDGFNEVDNDLKSIPVNGPFLEKIYHDVFLPSANSTLFSGSGSAPEISPQYKAGMADYQKFNSQVSDWFKTTPKTDVWENYSDTYGTGKLHAYYFKNPNNTNKTVISMHGYRQSADLFASSAKMFYDMGYNVLLPDQRGHGQSTGKTIDFGYYAKNDVVNWAKKINSMNGDDGKIMLYGISMGGGTVLQAAGQSELPKNVLGVIDDCGYSNVRDLFSSVVDHTISSIQAQFANRPLSPVYESLVNNLVAALNPSALLDDLGQDSLASQGFNLKQVSPKDQIAKSNLPLLVLDNEDDNLIPYEESIENYKASGAVDKNLVLLPPTIGPHGSASKDWDNYKGQVKQFTTRIFDGDKASEAQINFQNNLANASDINRTLYPAANLATRDATIRTAWISSLQDKIGDSGLEGLTAALNQYTSSDPLQPTDFSNNSIHLVPGINESKALSNGNSESFYINIPKSGQYALNLKYNLKTLGWVDSRIFNNAVNVSTLGSSYGTPINKQIASFSLPDIWKSTGAQKQLIYLPSGPQVIKVTVNDSRVNFGSLDLTSESGQDSLKVPTQAGQTETTSAANFSAATQGGYYALIDNIIEYTGKSGGQYLYPLSNISTGSYEVKVNYATPRLRSSLNFDLIDNKGTVSSMGQNQLAANNAVWDNYSHYSDSSTFKMHLTSTDAQYLRMTLNGTPANIKNISVTKISDN